MRLISCYYYYYYVHEYLLPNYVNEEAGRRLFESLYTVFHSQAKASWFSAVARSWSFSIFAVPELASCPLNSRVTTHATVSYSEQLPYEGCWTESFFLCTTRKYLSVCLNQKYPNAIGGSVRLTGRPPKHRRLISSFCVSMCTPRLALASCEYCDKTFNNWVGRHVLNSKPADNFWDCSLVLRSANPLSCGAKLTIYSAC